MNVHTVSTSNTFTSYKTIVTIGLEYINSETRFSLLLPYFSEALMKKSYSCLFQRIQCLRKEFYFLKNDGKLFLCEIIFEIISVDIFFNQCNCSLLQLADGKTCTGTGFPFLKMCLTCLKLLYIHKHNTYYILVHTHILVVV